MKLIHCRKCGAAICTEDGLVERMSDVIHELNVKARRSMDGRVARSYLAEAASVTKMMKGILHNTAQIEERRTTLLCENNELINYLLENDLITKKKLKELREIAREKARIRNEENQKEIDRIYGNFNSLYSPSNKTKADPTAKKAIRNINRKGGKK